MIEDSSLEISIGHHSAKGKRANNNDYVGALFQHQETQIAIADGMGENVEARVAAELSVRQFFDAFNHLPDTLGVERKASLSLTSINRWLYFCGRKHSTDKPYASTFSAAIFRGREAHIVHVGDTRIYRLRDNKLELLTRDHTLPQPDVQHVLYRAVGLEDSVLMDYRTTPIAKYDRYLFCSDGVHATVKQDELKAILIQREDPTATAKAIVSTSLDKGSHDNVTALIADVVKISALDGPLITRTFSKLPIASLPRVGQTLDGYRLEDIISDGRYTRIYRALDEDEHKQVIVIKFPKKELTADQTYFKAFAREAWIASNVKNRYIGEFIEQRLNRQTCLYLVSPYYPGRTLQQYIQQKHPIDLKKAVELITQIAKATNSLHRKRIIHRDIKPDNIIVLENGDTKLLDFGVARTPALDIDDESQTPGTPSYMAPEMFADEKGDIQTDVYALGVTLYYLLTQSYPYGEIEAFSHPRFGRYQTISNKRPDLPPWVDSTIRDAVSIDRAKRMNDALELIACLEDGLTRGTTIQAKRLSLYEKNPLLFWQLATALLFAALIFNLLH